jgi:pimeloyl-ACP methyl ester carboxylesterase
LQIEHQRSIEQRTKMSSKISKVLKWFAPLCIGLLAGCSADVVTGGESSNGDQVASEQEALSLTNKVFSLEHHIRVAPGVQLHVLEKFTAASLLRPHRRALLMLTGTLVTNNQYDAPSPYNALERAARAGYFGFAATYEGYGESTIPANGGTVTAERLLPEMGRVIEWIRHHRLVRRVDLLGASLGSSLAVELGGTQSPINRRHVGKLIITANVYKSVTPLFQAVFFNPEFRAFLEGAPNGYIQTPPEAYGLIVLQAEPAAAAYAFSAFPGVYATGPTLEGFDLPVFPAQRGRAPMMQFWGDQDPITPLADVQQFQAEYGGPACLSTLPGGGHAPYYEPVKETFWNQTFAFLNSNGDCWDHSYGDGCGDEVVGPQPVQALATVESAAAPVTTPGRVPYAW